MNRSPKRHLRLRLVFFFAGIALFYAPSALLVRALLAVTDSPYLPDAHRICLRMPFEWLSQPWMYPTMIREPLYLIGLLLLPAIAFFFGPLFCGWLCPAGAVTELLGRLVPNRFKLRLGGKLNPMPIRYGVLVGMFVSPYLGGYVCCTFCNFAMMQSLVNAVTNRDVPVIQMIVLLLAGFYVLVNIIADVVALLATPRRRLPR